MIPRIPTPVHLTATLVAVGLVLPCAAAIKARDKTVGLCTRKDEFVAKLEAIDPLVQKLSTAGSDDARDEIAAEIAKDFGGGTAIECLIRYREPEMARVFVKLLAHDHWPIRARALYGLKMVGGPDSVPAIAGALDDDEPQVRELAASALGHIGGDDALAALEQRAKDEGDPYVGATITASLKLAALDEKPYARLSQQADPWTETLDGPNGARRVRWDWTVKGKSSFNQYDAKNHEIPVAGEFCYPVSWYKDCLFAGYPRRSFGAGSGRHAGEDCAWFREGASYHAIADGVVRMVQGAGGDWGFLIVIEHLLAGGEYVTAVYGHCAWDVLVKPGDRVGKGQKIGSQGLSTSVENGGYGAHLHFGLGHGPYRRSGKIRIGSPINLKIDGKNTPGKVARFGYADKEMNKYGWPKVTALVALGGGKGRWITLPEEAPGAEVAWMQAYVPKCQGWLNPQTWLPDHVDEE